ncbi:septation protein SepH [Janibacter hoylei]|uniref:septation protein SepH n=2 Tax=Intrasporangiaceae TaxID=85021 RepID=UPI002490F6D1|nr:septation protein SepH [Janibacter hoylei]
MRDLRLIGVHDDGEHLLVTDDSGEEYRLRIDEPLRAAARRDRPRLGQLQIAIDNNVRPREVQAMIRAGASADEVAARTGWDLDKIARFEGPVLAEREHVATRAQAVRMRGTNQAGSPETLAQRATIRLTGRGVEPSSVVWDACRDGEGQWTVSAVFTAGGRERTATWWFDLAGMSVVAKNDEAKWLSEADTPAGPVPTTVHRPTAVFDVEVEETKVERAQRANTDDLINSMREHSGAKSRRRGGRRKTRAAAETAPAEDALPIDELPPPAGGTHPRDEESPERAAAAAREESTADTTAEQAAAADEAKGSTRPAEDDAPAPTADADTGADEAPEDETTVDEPVDEETASEPDVSDEDDADHADTEQDEADQTSEADSGSKSRGRKGRARVPSWDDVMFGTTRD